MLLLSVEHGFRTRSESSERPIVERGHRGDGEIVADNYFCWHWEVEVVLFHTSCCVSWKKRLIVNIISIMSIIETRIPTKRIG